MEAVEADTRGFRSNLEARIKTLLSSTWTGTIKLLQ